MTKAATHADAARLAVEAGFDALEVHCGHYYLVSAFLSPRLNRRDDDHGGSLANRARLALAVTRAVRDAVGDRVAVTAKLNMDDGVRGGLQVEESLQVAAWLEREGTVDALELTAGSSLLNPMYLFTGDAPCASSPRCSRRRCGGDCVCPGVRSYGTTVDAALGEGFAFVAMARALLREPDLPRRLAAEPGTRSSCTHCNKCVPTIYRGTRCVLTTPAVHSGPAG